MWDEDEDIAGDTVCAAWTLRLVAGVCVFCGARASAAVALADEERCPHAPALGVFWALVQRLGGVWLAFDVASCAFCLRCMWVLPRIGRFARIYGAALFFLAVYGLTNYALQMREDRTCWGAGSLFAILILAVYAFIWLMWLVLIDCDSLFCSGYADVGGACCEEGLFELREWPACREDSDEDLSKAELGSLKRGASLTASPAALTSPGGAGSSSGPSPAVLGKPRLERGSSSKDLPLREGAAGPRQRVRNEIRVLRNGELLHVGRTRRGVKRWLRRHLQDPRGVTVEDRLAGPSALPQSRGSASGRPPAAAAAARRRPTSASPHTAGAASRNAGNHGGGGTGFAGGGESGGSLQVAPPLPLPAAAAGRAGRRGSDGEAGGGASRSHSSSQSSSPKRPKQVPPLDLSGLLRS